MLGCGNPNIASLASGNTELYDLMDHRVGPTSPEFMTGSPARIRW